MTEYSDDKGQSIVEMSLTELAFIFFFILLIFSVWKISNSNELIQKHETEIQMLENKTRQLQSTLTEIYALLDSENIVDPEELFMELSLAKQQASQAKELANKNKMLQNQISSLSNKLSKIFDHTDQDENEVIEALKNYNEMTKVLEKNLVLDNSAGLTVSEQLSTLLQESSERKGQNEYLRKKVKSMGSGLDHPPCWTNEKGNTQYLYNVYINEEFVEFKKGWPASRQKQALENGNIMKVIGTFKNNQELWKVSSSIYNDSITENCRHVVRIYDLAVSKKAYKYFLSGVENHFYKSFRKTETN